MYEREPPTSTDGNANKVAQAGLLEKQYKKLVAAPTAATPPEEEEMEIEA